MGIVNVSPDSFSDGGLYSDTGKAVEHGLRLFEEGADIIDVGGESTRPGSRPVPESLELSRVVPVIKKLRRELPSLTISIDSYKSTVAQAAIEAGADMINDISSLQFDKQMIALLKANPQVTVVLMHIRGTPKDMQKNPRYDDVVADIIGFLEQRIEYCVENGVQKRRIIVDPGIGFGKNLAHNLLLIRNLDKFHALQVPVLLGASRKSFINKVYPSMPQERLPGSLAAAAYAIKNGVDYLRVHDIKEHQQFIDLFYAIGQTEAQGVSS